MINTLQVKTSVVPSSGPGHHVSGVSIIFSKMCLKNLVESPPLHSSQTDQTEFQIRAVHTQPIVCVLAW